MPVLLASFLLPPLPTLSERAEVQGTSATGFAEDLEPEVSVDATGPDSARAESTEIQLFNIANQDRGAHGLPPLQYDHQLLEVARLRAAAQAGLPSLSHLDTSGQLAFVRLIADSDVRYRMVGENLARVANPPDTAAQRAAQALMSSPAHRANILQPAFDSLIVGTAVDPSGQIVFAQIFRGV